MNSVILGIGVVVMTCLLTMMSRNLKEIRQTCNHNVTEATKTINSMQEDVQKQEQTVAVLQERVNGMATQMGSLDAKVDNLGKTIQTNFNEVLNRLDRQATRSPSGN